MLVKALVATLKDTRYLKSALWHDEVDFAAHLFCFRLALSALVFSTVLTIIKSLPILAL